MAIDEETMETVTDFIFLGSKITADGDCSHELKRRLLLGRKVMINLDSVFKSRDITFLTKIHLVRAVVFSTNHVWMWESDHKEGWMSKNWRFWTVVLEKTTESPLDCKEIQAVNLKGNQSWILTGRTDVEAEAPILWPCDVKNWLIGKDPDAGKDWRWEEKGTTEDEMVGWHHWEQFEQAPGVGDDDREAWRAAVRGVAKSRPRLSDWTTRPFQHVVVFAYLETLWIPWLLGFYRNPLTRAWSGINSMSNSSPLTWEWGGRNWAF